ncbi:MAG: response regulator [Deltaproteobacteria bacterium]|nr:response regulator [Deltaproteobacteria bacterium]
MTEHDKKILFVDCDERLRRLCSGALTSAGYQVETASNGIEALRRITEGPYGLVIIDVNTPGLDGIALYTRALKLCQRMKDRFLFMTEGLNREIERLSPGILNRCVLKPFSITELLTAVESFPEGKPAAVGPRNPVIHDKDRRVEKRFVWEVDCRVTGHGTYNPKPCTTTADISVNGIRIRHIGAPLPSPSGVKVEVRCLRVKTAARVVWATAVNELESEAGLKLSLPISYSSILAAVQGSHISIPRQSRRQ